jgi:hypothetical protein
MPSFIEWSVPKDPQSIIDYKVDWSQWLGAGDTIINSEWSVPADITKQSDSFDDTSATIWLQEGVEGMTYLFINRVTTSGGRSQDMSVVLKVESR